MERGVEDGDLRQVGPQRLGGADPGEVGRVVQRGHRDEPLDLGEHGVVDDGRLGEGLPAVHHPVPDRGQFRRVQTEAVLGELLGDGLQGGVVIGDRPAALPALAARRGVLEPGGLLTDTFDKTHRQPAAVAHVEQLVLQRRGAGVQDEDTGRAHWAVAFSLGDGDGDGDWAWIAVMATVLTMSWTRAPRDRSLTGLRRPWSTGPTAIAPAERCTAL